MKTLLHFFRKNEEENSIAEDLSIQVLNSHSMLSIRGGDDPPNNDTPPNSSGDDPCFPDD